MLIQGKRVEMLSRITNRATNFIWIPSLNALDCPVENRVISFIKPVIRKHLGKTQYENILSYLGKLSVCL